MTQFALPNGVVVSVPSDIYVVNEPFLIFIDGETSEPWRLGIQLFTVSDRVVNASMAGGANVPANAANFEVNFQGSPGHRGLHLLSFLPLPAGEGTRILVRSPFEMPVWVKESEGDLNPDPKAEFARAEKLQNAFRDKVLTSEGYTGSRTFEATFYLEKCLLDYPQPIEGGMVVPLPFTLKPTSYMEAVNWAVQGQPSGDKPFPLTPLMEAEFGFNHPLTLVVFNNVCAPDRPSVLATVRQRVELLCGILASERGAIPNPFAWVSYEHGVGEGILSFLRDPYPGNLAAGWDAGKITKLHSEYMAAISTDPWIELLLSMRRETLAERNPLFRVFREWGMLEACAKRRALNGFDALVKRKDVWVMGESEVRGHDLAKVCYYVATELCSSPDLEGKEHHFTRLAEAYRIRNIAAHEGALRPVEAYPEATQQAIQNVLGPLGRHGPFGLEHWCERALERERLRALEATA